MKKYLYLIPGWEDTCLDESYVKISETAKKSGYEVIPINVDWKKPLSEQVFTVERNSVVFGFSLGAILGWLLAQKQEVDLLILASMTPHYSFTDSEIKQALIDLTGDAFTEDIIKTLTGKNKAKRQVIMYGDQEGEPADILVSNTEHELTDVYIQEISNLH